MQRTIEAPEKEWLSAEEAAVWLNIPDTAFRLMAKRGIIPRGLRFTSKTICWHWEVVVAVSVMLKTGCLKIPREEPKKPKAKPTA